MPARTTGFPRSSLPSSGRRILPVTRARLPPNGAYYRWLTLQSLIGRHVPPEWEYFYVERRWSRGMLTPIPLCGTATELMKPGEGIKSHRTRITLYFLSWCGFVINFIQRSDINFAIIKMVAPARDTQNFSICHEKDQNVYGTMYGLHWSFKEQCMLLSSYYWTYCTSQILGGWAVHKYGTKLIFGSAQLISSLTSLVFPIVSEGHFWLAVIMKLVAGFVSGLTWPAMYAIVAHWIPSEDRTRFMTSFQGMTIGVGCSYIIFGLAMTFYSWHIVFYTSGSLGLLFCVFWFLLVYNTPEEHPWISERELYAIQVKKVRTFQAINRERIPWTAICFSTAVWAVAVSSFGQTFVYYFFIICMPSYFSQILGFTILENGVIAGTPFLINYLLALVFVAIGERLEKIKGLSLTLNRQLFTAISQIGPGVIAIAMSFLTCQRMMIISCYYIAVGLLGAACAGSLIIPMDMAPNFAGPVVAFCQTIHMTAAILVTFLMAIYTMGGHSIEAWSNLFLWTGIISIVTYMAFLLGGTSTTQPWNYFGLVEAPEVDMDKEMITVLKTYTAKSDHALNSEALKKKKERHQRVDFPDVKDVEVPTTSRARVVSKPSQEHEVIESSYDMMKTKKKKDKRKLSRKSSSLINTGEKVRKSRSGIISTPSVTSVEFKPKKKKTGDPQSTKNKVQLLKDIEDFREKD